MNRADAAEALSGPLSLRRRAVPRPEAVPAQRRRALRWLGAGAAATLAPMVLAQGTPAVLRFGWWGGAGRHEATLKAVRLFERREAARGSSVRIKAEYMGFNGYLERLTTQVAGRSEPDVMQINWAWLAMFSKRGTGFTDLAPLLSPAVREQIPEADLATGRIAGRLNALPVSYTARVLLWNQGTFDKLERPLPRSWDELFALGPVFRRTLGEAAFPLDGELYDMLLLAQAWVQQMHGTPFIAADSSAESATDSSADSATKGPRVAMDEAAALDWVRIYKRLVDEHVATPLPLRASLGGAEKPTEQQPDWVSGRWAGNYTWDSVIGLRASTLKGEHRLALGPFPMQPGARASGIFGRPALMFAVGRHCRRPELAARFVEFLLVDPEAARLLGRTRGLPVARAPLALLREAGQLPPLELAAHAQIALQREAGRIPLPAPLFEHPRLHKFMREVFETVAYGKTSAADAARRLRVDGQALLQRLK
ncbi:MAG: carbohydrate ABC transporter substrate-binding protein [Burkholderiales bacterium]|nr:carbohydrate ABC transporter substrate-binding protein [Burkholderiales bacterium]